MTLRSITHLVLFAVTGLFLSSCSSRLDDYGYLLIGKPAGKMTRPSGHEVQITYLGTNGYIVRSHDTTIVIDPYFTRMPMRAIVLNSRVEPSYPEIRKAAHHAGLAKKVDGFLVTHAHFDHHFDVPVMQRMFGGKIIGSQTAGHLAEASGVFRRDLLPSKVGTVHRIGNAKVRVLASEHDRIFGCLPFPGVVDHEMEAPPAGVRDWVMGEPLAYLIEIEGHRIYIESGGAPGQIPAVKDVDIAIVGVAVKGSQQRYPDAVRQLNPRYVIPSHQDNFFTPMDSGFRFSALADFPQILASHKAGNLPGRLILMDYFDTISTAELPR
ncbi:MAG: MBL fold metallo-hydrolase [Luteolibacter sp.]